MPEVKALLEETPNDTILVLAAEFETLGIRLIQIDSDFFDQQIKALGDLSRKMRIQRAVEKHFQ